MKRRRLALGTLAALALAALALGLVIALMPASPEREAFDRVRVGMTFEEVAEILAPVAAGYHDLSPRDGLWAVRGGAIVLEFDDDQRVTAKRFEGRSWLSDWSDWLAGKLGL